MPLTALRNSVFVFGAAIVLSACSDKAADETAGLKHDMAAGRYQSAYNDAREIEANPGGYSPEELAYAHEARERAEVVLLNHYGGNLRAHVASGNVDAALGMWTELQSKSPELLEKDMDIYRRMMRVYATRKLWDLALQTAETVRSRATKAEDRDDAEQFISTYNGLIDAKREFDGLQARVVEIGDRTGIELGGGIGCGASDKLTAEDKATLEAWEMSNMKVSELNFKLTQLLPPPAEDAASVEAENSTG